VKRTLNARTDGPMIEEVRQQDVRLFFKQPTVVAGFRHGSGLTRLWW
jgi:hypothetical protein